jgi:hypothetical protein
VPHDAIFEGRTTIKQCLSYSTQLAASMIGCMKPSNHVVLAAGHAFIIDGFTTILSGD